MHVMRILAGGLILLGTVSLGQAQNARIDAMGSCGIIEDYARVLGSPADIVYYPDQIQATGGGGLGLVIASKRMGDLLTLGGIGNHPGFLRSDFYANAIDAFDDLQDGTIPPDLPDGTAFPRIPHVILGIDLGAIQLGFDIFGELALSKYTFESSNDDNQDASARIYNVGTVVNANIDLDGITLSPLLGLGLPGIYAKSETIPQGGGAASTDELETEENFLLLGGLDGVFELNDLSLIVGAFYAHESYQFRTTEGGVSQTSSSYPAHFVDIYAGVVGQALGDLLWVAQYDFSLDIISENSQTEEESTIDRLHFLHAGLEKPLMNIWIFDQMIGRAGLEVQFSDQSINTDVSTEQTRINGSNTVTSVDPTVGLGLRRGGWRFDIVTRLSGWDGLVAGPPVAEGTLTFDFGGGEMRRPETTPSIPDQSPPAYEPESETEDFGTDGGFDF